MKIIQKFIAKIFNSFLVGKNPYINYDKLEKPTANPTIIGKENLQIGQDSVVYPESRIYNLGLTQSIIIGNNTHIRGEIFLYPYAKRLIIGNNCYVGQNSIIRAGESILIGNNVLIAHNVTILDTDSHEIDEIERAESFLSLIKNGHPKKKGNVLTSPIIIEDNAWISYNVGILKGVKVGKNAIIAAGAIVTKDVPDNCIVAGNPARIIKKLK